MQQGPQDQYNPYAPPTAGADLYGIPPQDHQFHVLASRGTRFGARFLDGLLAMGSAIPFMVAIFANIENSSSYSSSYDPDPFSTMFSGLALVMLLPILGLQFYQWYLIARDGQTLAKRWLKIKIIKQDGSSVDFVSGVILREWVLAFAGAIPYIGNFVGLIDAVMIFGDQQLCLHDHIAKTKVIAVM